MRRAAASCLHKAFPGKAAQLSWLLLFFSLRAIGAEGVFVPYLEIRIAPWAELSGLVFDPSRGAFIAVGDEGDIFVISQAGEIAEHHVIPKADLEDVGLDSKGRVLYVLDEAIPEIYVLDADTFQFQGKIDLWQPGKAFKKFRENSDGYEGLVFLPPGKAGEKARLMVSNQVLATGSKLEKGSGILIMALDGSEARFVSTGLYDCAGLALDPDGKKAWAILDIPNEVFEIRPDGSVGLHFHLPGKNQEGITWAGNDFAVISEDGVFRVGRLGGKFAFRR